MSDHQEPRQPARVPPSNDGRAPTRAIADVARILRRRRRRLREDVAGRAPPRG